MTWAHFWYLFHLDACAKKQDCSDVEIRLFGAQGLYRTENWIDESVLCGPQNKNVISECAGGKFLFLLTFWAFKWKWNGEMHDAYIIRELNDSCCYAMENDKPQKVISLCWLNEPIWFQSLGWHHLWQFRQSFLLPFSFPREISKFVVTFVIENPWPFSTTDFNAFMGPEAKTIESQRCCSAMKRSEINLHV